MPSLLRDTECPACGRRHNFYSDGDDLSAGREYQYVCPETGKKAMLRPASSAEVVHSPPQGAVALAPAAYDPVPHPGPEPPEGGTHAQAPPHAQPAAPGAPPEGARAGVGTPASGTASAAQRLQAVEGQVQTLAARLADLEQGAAHPGAGQSPADTQRQTAGGAGPAVGPTWLQDILPEVKDLAGRVGGLDHLAEIVDTLRRMKEG